MVIVPRLVSSSLSSPWLLMGQGSIVNSGLQLHPYPSLFPDPIQYSCQYSLGSMAILGGELGRTDGEAPKSCSVKDVTIKLLS